MNEVKLTTKEAEVLIEMLKYSLIREIELPSAGGYIDFDVKGTTEKDLFSIHIYRGKINHAKYNMNAMIKRNNIQLLELHINPGSIHVNPDGEKICGSHWHIYTEEHGRRYAYPADDIHSATFVENTILFMNKFHIVEQPEIYYQSELP